MKRSVVLILNAFIAITASSQSVAVFSEGDKVMGRLSTAVDSIVFYDDDKALQGVSTENPSVREIDGRWCSLGTSITWYNDQIAKTNGKITAGYQTRVMNKLKFKYFTNSGVNGGTVSSSINNVVYADYYTIEHGINDWGKKVTPGTFDDYLNDTGNGSFAASYRKLIDKIYQTNPDARIVICTPRKGYGYKGYLPDKWDDAINGNYLQDYVDIVRKIADYEGIPVADFFSECGGQHNLHRLSMDVALHPNDIGYQLMANVLVQALIKVIN